MLENNYKGSLTGRIIKTLNKKFLVLFVQSSNPLMVNFAVHPFGFDKNCTSTCPQNLWLVVKSNNNNNNCLFTIGRDQQFKR